VIIVKVDVVLVVVYNHAKIVQVLKQMLMTSNNNNKDNSKARNKNSKKSKNSKMKMINNYEHLFIYVIK